jgi:hypothetical protein
MIYYLTFAETLLQCDSIMVCDSKHIDNMHLLVISSLCSYTHYCYMCLTPMHTHCQLLELTIRLTALYAHLTTTHTSLTHT